MANPVLWCASLLGALAGAMAGERRASACSCSPPAWRLTLRTATDGGSASDTQGWPASARLESRPGTVVMWSEQLAGETIDRLHAGEP
jgi:hypothetical protein